MDLSKSFEFFDPSTCPDDLCVIGCGSVGSTVAELLTRFGLENIMLYDFDVVEEHNLANQMFTRKDLYQKKVYAVGDNLLAINPALKDTIRYYSEGWKPGQRLSGYVFLCVDDIDLRRKIVEENKYNLNIKAIFDFRTALTECQHYAADWSKAQDKKDLLNWMDFTHEEAQKAVPVSACNVPLCVAPTVRLVANMGVCNFINFVKGEPLKKALVGNAFTFMLEEI